MWCKGNKFQPSCSLLQENRLMISWEVFICLFYFWLTAPLFYWIWKAWSGKEQSKPEETEQAVLICILPGSPLSVFFLWRKEIGTEYSRSREVQSVTSAPNPSSLPDERSAQSSTALESWVSKNVLQLSSEQWLSAGKCCYQQPWGCFISATWHLLATASKAACLFLHKEILRKMHRVGMQLCCSS